MTALDKRPIRQIKGFYKGQCNADGKLNNRQDRADDGVKRTAG